MTQAAQDLLTAFDALPPEDRQEVAAEIIRRASRSEDLSEAALHELADELFRSYDAAETARALS